jgi:hypothetical protein
MAKKKTGRPGRPKAEERAPQPFTALELQRHAELLNTLSERLEAFSHKMTDGGYETLLFSNLKSFKDAVDALQKFSARTDEAWLARPAKSSNAENAGASP